jgi:adhesin transport system membrane fusion protein
MINFSKDKQIHLGGRERKLLSDSIHVEEELIPSFVRPVLYVVAGLVLGFLLWASLTHMKEIARAPGEIIPYTKAKMVQHLEGGAVAEVKVEERQLVEEGQLLLRIDGSQALAELGQMAARLDSLQLREERLMAYTERKEPSFPASDKASLLSSQKDLFTLQMATRQSTLSILERQIDQRKQRIHQLNAALGIANKNLTLSEELADMREDLASRRLITRTALLEAQRGRVTASGDVARLVDELQVAQQELAEAQNRYVDTQNQMQRDALNELGVVRAELAEVREGIQRLKARVQRLEVRAPSRGYVQDLRVQNIGQIFQPGALMMQIVSDQAVVEAEVRISPRDIGFVRPGQPVNLRVSSFDYSRFGVAKGVLKRISASSLMDETNNQPYFKGVVELSSPHVGNTPGRNLLQPGMRAEAEILTGEKTLLAYLTKPLIDVVSLSFQER